MADVSKISLYGTTYTIKDSTARTNTTAAQTTANAAQAKAEAAQTTANTAQAKAEAAQTTADTAQTKAETAQTTANEAKDAALVISYTDKTETIVVEKLAK